MYQLKQPEIAHCNCLQLSHFRYFHTAAELLHNYKCKQTRFSNYLLKIILITAFNN